MVGMLIAEVLYPEVANIDIECIECNLCYSPKDYDTLYKAWKIKYFFISSSNSKVDKDDTEIVVCHNCLLNILKDVHSDMEEHYPDTPQIIKFKVLTRHSEIELEFDMDADKLNEGTNMDDFLAAIDTLDDSHNDEKNDIFDDDPRDTDDTREDDTDDLDWE